jgi:thioredoxin 1
MSVHLPHTSSLRERLAQPFEFLVACYCADWCDTCTIYRERLEALARAHPQHVFVWIDIEDQPQLLGDEDVENFPTLLIEHDDKVLFFGTMLPHIQQLERLLASLASAPASAPVSSSLPVLRQALTQTNSDESS